MLLQIDLTFVHGINLTISLTFTAMSEQKYILVTGGVGFLGSHTVVSLYEHGFVPIIADDFRNSDRSIPEGLKKITGEDPIIYEVDVCDQLKLRKIFNDFDLQGIIHFAADKSVIESVKEPLKYYENNIGSLVNCIKLAEEYKVNNFVFSSSCTVYGEPDHTIVTEESPIKEAQSPYGATKQICERIIQDVNQRGSNIKFLSLRYFNPIGAHPSSNIGELPNGVPDNLVPYVTQTAIGIRDKLTVFGNDYDTPDGSCLRDFIHVMDLAEAHISGLKWLMSNTSGISEVVNIGAGRGVSVLEIIHTFEEVSGLKLNWEFGPRRDGDVGKIYADITKAKNILGWTPKFDVTAAMKHAWEWEQKIAE